MNFNFNNNYINILIKIYIYDVLIATSIKAENIFLSKTYSSTVAMTNKFMARVRDMPYVIYFANTSLCRFIMAIRKSCRSDLCCFKNNIEICRLFTFVKKTVFLKL